MSRTLQDEWGKCEGFRKGTRVQNRCITSHSLWLQNCSSLSLKNVPSISPQYHIRSLYGLQTNLLQAPRALTVRPPTGFQQSQDNINHFWKKDTALVKALRQYHFTSNVLEGRTQWKFQKSRILHKVLDVIAREHGEHREVPGLLLLNAHGPRVPVSRPEPPSPEGRGGERGSTPHYGPCTG